jgi:hypothetical protein
MPYFAVLYSLKCQSLSSRRAPVSNFTRWTAAGAFVLSRTSLQRPAKPQTADEPGVVADVVLAAARAARPKLRYTAGSLANRLRLLRRFAPAGAVDAGIRRSLRLDVRVASPRATKALG